jgi:putative DNA primase/helicase
VILSNELPPFGDASGAIATRFVTLVGTRSFLNHEDIALTDKLRTELTAILNWSLVGLDRLHERGHFTEPKSSRDAMITLADLASPVAAFVRERCIREGDVLCSELFDTWKQWADDNGHKPGSTATFGANLRAAVPGVQVSRPRDGEARQRRYTGVSLR